MRIIDKTPYRSESGEIDVLGRVQGTLKYGLTWYNRIQAQDVVIALLEKQLGNNYTLLRNIVLPETEIDLPLILVGPPGIFLINVTHERGVYRARDEEWGTISGEQFVPARINQVKRTQAMGRVLQVYLDRQGYKGVLMVDPILMAADPGMHIDSTRPAVRIVLSDALERFAISLNQSRLVLTPEAVSTLAQTILVGRKTAAAQQAAPLPEVTSQQPAANSAFFTQESDSDGFSSNAFDFSFDESASGQDEPTSEAQQPDQPERKPARAAAPAARPVPKSKGPLGITSRQWLILGLILFAWLCLMGAFAAYVYYQLYIAPFAV